MIFCRVLWFSCWSTGVADHFRTCSSHLDMAFLHGVKTPGCLRSLGFCSVWPWQRCRLPKSKVRGRSSWGTNRAGGMDDGNFQLRVCFFQAKNSAKIGPFFLRFLFDKVGWKTRLVWQGFIWQKIWDKVKFLLENKRVAVVTPSLEAPSCHASFRQLEARMEMLGEARSCEKVKRSLAAYVSQCVFF